MKLILILMWLDLIVDLWTSHFPQLPPWHFTNLMQLPPTVPHRVWVSPPNVFPFAHARVFFPQFSLSQYQLTCINRPKTQERWLSSLPNPTFGQKTKRTNPPQSTWNCSSDIKSLGHWSRQSHDCGHGVKRVGAKSRTRGKWKTSAVGVWRAWPKWFDAVECTSSAFLVSWRRLVDQEGAPSDSRRIAIGKLETRVYTQCECQCWSAA